MENTMLTGLIEKFRKGDMSAFAVIYEGYKKLIAYYSKKLGGEDYTQELTLFFIELLYDIEIKRFKYYSENALHNYIAVALRNKYIALSKEQQKYDVFLHNTFEKDFICNTSPVKSLELKEFLKLLSKRQQTVIIYKYIYGYSEKEISDFLNVTVQAVYRLKKRALSTFEDYYGGK